ncbi:DUF3422 domain-containing protein [Stakelama marina]|uniref:DUF3422 domain-containing protein n=1 Tax=Stakelama marina TaxID=2826939 RepID=A0A8T4IC40_9SPHN|nr:DUF3422 domain-containing protein [Stakelama marina]MBR0552598.1 DUF3422 domain-containing protein [Stakelama marina]
MTIASHPLRASAVAEMHLRQMPPLTVPCRVRQTVRLPSAKERAAERQAVEAMLGTADAKPDARHLSGSPDRGIALAWERHTEASTTLLVVSDGVDAETERRYIDWLEDLPGPVMRATLLDLVEDEAAALPLVAEAGFEAAETVSCNIQGARIWTNFRLAKGHDYGRMIVAAHDTHPADLARTIQQLQELGNYRNLALLGLAVAQQRGAEVTAIERDLSAATGRMGETADRKLLEGLTMLAAKVAALRAETEYRMSATAAYGQIVQDRLESLAPQPIAGFQNLSEFTERRLLPALRTCASFRRRLEAVALRIEQTTAMLRTRVDLELQDQNAALLGSMERNAVRQLRLQHLVEGLSVIALTYYAIALLEKLLDAGQEAHWLPASAEKLAALAILPVLVTFSLLVRWRAHRAEKL